MKAVLVIDMPSEAKIEEYMITYVVYHTGEHGEGVQGVGIPLRPLPSKLVPFGYLDVGNEDGLYEKGYNDCIDEITGETE